VVSLAEAAVEQAQCVYLFRSFDALSDDGEVEGGSESEDCV
jgi:hypothetical protein